MASAVTPLSGLQIGLETVEAPGSAVVTTRELYPSSAGYLDPGYVWTRHEGVQRGTFSNITHATNTSNLPTIGYSTEPSHGLTFDDLPIILSQFKSGLAGVGAGADKVYDTGIVGAATHTFSTFTLNAFDATQCYEINNAFMTDFSISAGFDDLTQSSQSWVGKSISKQTVDAVAANNAVKIPSGLWAVKYAALQASLGAAEVYANTVRSWELSFQLPQHPRFYADGSLGFGQGVASRNLSGTLTMTWDSDAAALAMYDLAVAGTSAWFRFTATGPTLGGATYVAGPIDVCVIFDPVTPLASESDGVMEYSMTGHLAYNATFAGSAQLGATCSLATICTV